MAKEVYMDVPAVRDIAKTFGQISEVLEAVDKVLKGLIEILNVTAFIGLVGGLALKLFLEAIEPQIKKMADKCKELMRDVNASVTAYERGDQQGATRFY